MNIFILEDNEFRIRWFKNTFSDCTLFITKDFDTACDYLRNNHFDLIFLDRDLDEPQLVKDTDKTGEDVAKIMEEEELSINATVVIHTLNYHGRRAIYDRLKDTYKNLYIIPFLNLMKSKREDFELKS